MFDAKERLGGAVAAGAARPWPSPLHGSVNDRVNPGDEMFNRAGFAQAAGNPLDSPGGIIETTPIATTAVPAAQAMPGASKMTHNIAPEKATRAGDRDMHTGFLFWFGLFFMVREFATCWQRVWMRETHLGLQEMRKMLTLGL
jgi:hypothetical protein